MVDVKGSDAADEISSKIAPPSESKVGMCDICLKELIREPYIVCAVCTITVCMKHGVRVMNGPDGLQMWCIPCYRDDIE